MKTTDQAWLTITGTGFQSGMTVTIGKKVFTNVSTTPTLFKVQLPIGTMTGAKYDVQVSRKDGATVRLAGVITVRGAPPVITKVNPTSMRTGSGTVQVTISGNQFSSQVIVRVGNNQPLTYVKRTKNQIVVKVSQKNLKRGQKLGISVRNPDDLVATATSNLIVK